jgi:prevent-host-death family protein
MFDSNQKGAIAEAEIAAAATRLGIPVLRPIQEHGRYDLGLEVGGGILRVQCKWARLDRDAGVVKIGLNTCRHSPTGGYIRSPYRAGEVDLVAAYCADLDRCYLLPIGLVAGRKAIDLRISPPKNGQRACINLDQDFLLPGAVAQLEERLNGIQEARGSNPLSSTPTDDGPKRVHIGSNEFRHHFGWYLERAAAGEEIHISRRGKPYARLLPVEPPQR